MSNSSTMTPREIQRLVEDYIGTNGGYLNHFSYAKHDQFYHIYCDLEVDVAEYRERGRTTKAAFIEILKESKPRDQAKIIRGAFDMIPPPEEDDESDEAKRRRSAHSILLQTAARLESDGEIPTPELLTSETVLEALRDAETLLRERGPKSAVDRAHTALHGYLKHECGKRSIPLPSDPSLTAVFKVVREQFPEFKDTVAHDEHAKRLFGAMSSALDNLNTIRNRATLAHPNELLLEAPEAMLFINLARALLTYLESRLRPCF